MKYVEVKEIGSNIVQDSQGRYQELVILQGADDHVFSVLGSYIEQSAGPLTSPYGDYEYVFAADPAEFNGAAMYEKNDGNYLMPFEVDTPFS